MAYNASYRVEFKDGKVVYFKHYGTKVENFNAMAEYCWENYKNIKTIYSSGKNVTSEFIDC